MRRLRARFAGRVIHGHPRQVAAETVLDDDRRRRLANPGGIGQFLRPDVQDLEEELSLLLGVGLRGNLIVPDVPDLADPVVRRRLLGMPEGHAGELGRPGLAQKILEGRGVDGLHVDPIF